MEATVYGKVLDVKEIFQEQNQWCWIGTSLPVLKYYGDTQLKQCDVANFAWKNAKWRTCNDNCCSNPTGCCNYWNYNWYGSENADGDIEHILWSASSQAKVDVTNVSGSVSQTQVNTAISDDRPLIIRVNSGGHFIVLHGLEGNTLYYMDPWPGEGKGYQTFSTSAVNGRSWTHTQTCTTKPNPNPTPTPTPNPTPNPTPTPTPNPTPTPTPGPDPTPTPDPTDKSVGITEVFATTTNITNRRAVSYTMPEDGVIKSITLYHLSGSGQMILGVYAGEAQPADLLGKTQSVAVDGVDGWQTVGLTSPAYVAKGTKIWLAWVFQYNPGIIVYQAGSSPRADAGVGWPEGMPDSFGNSTLANYSYSIYATYEPAVSPTPTPTPQPTPTPTPDPNPDPYSCEGYCRSKAPGGCYCDYYCIRYQDCCRDKIQVCGE